MYFNVVSKDEMYIESLKSYYDKFYKDELVCLFNEDVDDYKIVCESDKKNLYINPIILGKENNILKNEIAKFQSADSFFDFLKNYETQKVNSNNKKIYGFINGVSNSGSSILSLNLMDMLSSSSKVFYISLEENNSIENYIEDVSDINISDIVFFLNDNEEIIRAKLNELYNKNINYVVLGKYRYIEDYYELSEKSISKFIKILNEVGFNNIIIDFGSNYRLFKKIDVDIRFVIIKHSINDYKRVKNVYDYFYDLDNLELIVNMRKSDKYINEGLLRVSDKFHYIDMDYNISKESKRWQSEQIQSQIKNLLKAK